MDLPVEATVRLDVFPDKAKVRDILRSHGFTLTDLSGDRVRVKGSFLDLKAAKASLEPLLSSKYIPAVPKASSGAISKRPAGNSSVSVGNRGRSKSPRASQSSANASSPWASPPHTHPSSPESRASFSPPPDQRGSFRPGRESFVVDVDVWRYAEQLRKKDIEDIRVSHHVEMEVREVGESCDVTLLGKSAISRKNTESDSGAGAIATPVPVGSFRGRSRSGYRENTRAESIYVQEMENKRPSPKPGRKLLKQLMKFPADIGKKFKSLRK